MNLNNIKSLDGIRTLAITLVIICHYFTYQVSSHFLNGNMKYIKNFTFWTWSGVDLFFILSGFLIGRILIYNKGSKNYFKAFYMRRFFRIFPAYYLILLGFFIILLFGFGSKFPFLCEHAFPMYTYFLYIQNFWVAHVNNFGAHWLGITWSLALEEQFYLILPLVIFFINIKHLPKLLIACILLSPIIRAITPGLGSYVLLPSRMDSLLFGVLVAYYHLNGSIERWFSDKQNILKGLLIVSFGLMFFVGHYEDMGGIFIHSALTLFYGTLLIFVLVAKQDSLFIKILSSSPMTFMAKISYMVYLTHQIFSGILHQLILKQSPQIDNYKSALVTISALIITIVFSTISFYIFEKPMLSIGKKFNY
jgi:peptidoglycan/LPS O-acetylase OafA/YrhL